MRAPEMMDHYTNFVILKPVQFPSVLDTAPPDTRSISKYMQWCTTCTQCLSIVGIFWWLYLSQELKYCRVGNKRKLLAGVFATA